MFVREALFDESSAEPGSLLVPLWSLRHKAANIKILHQVHVLEGLDSEFRQRVTILGHNLSWSLSRIPDLDHGVLDVNAISLTHFTDVIVILDSALVADSNNWRSITAITDDTLVDNLALNLSLGVDMVDEHLFEGRLADISDFIPDVLDGHLSIAIITSNSHLLLSLILDDWFSLLHGRLLHIV